MRERNLHGFVQKGRIGVGGLRMCWWLGIEDLYDHLRRGTSGSRLPRVGFPQLSRCEGLKQRIARG